MKLGFATYALMLSIILYGVLLGGIVYSHIVYFPVYLSHLPESSILVNGEFGLTEGLFWMTIHPLAILSLVVTLAANWRDKTRRRLIAVPLAVYILMMVITAIYFVPELGEFKNSPNSNISTSEWQARGQRWQHLSWLRGGTLFVFSVPLLLALAKPKDETR